MKITPYSVLKLTNGNYFFVESVVQRRCEMGLLPNKIVCGTEIKEQKYSSVKLVLEGESNKEQFNLRTASYQEFSNFFYNNSSMCSKSTWVNLEHVEAIVDRESIEFKIRNLQKI